MSACSGESVARGSLLRIAKVRRGEYLAGLCILGCVSGLTPRIVQSIHRLGWTDALFNTFEISAIVWVSCVTGVYLISRDRTVGLGRRELALGAGYISVVVLPIGPLSWIALTALCAYVLATSNVDTSRRGALILLATTVPMFWSCLLFHFFANPILAVDASLVSWIIGSHRTGTLVEFADRSAQLAILPACSSLANVSLAILCWATFSQAFGHRKSIYDVLWCLLACASVVLVNVTRISLAGLSNWHYATFHGPLGQAVANVLILGLIVGVSVLGVRRELFQGA